MQTYQPLESCQRGGEDKKVPLSRWPAAVLAVGTAHILAIAGACVIIILNVDGVWIGKELQGSINEDGKKRFGLQLAAKCHEIFMVSSLSYMLCAAVLKFLARGRTLPFAALGAGLRVQSVSFLFSKEYMALCLASFPGKIYLLTAVALCALLGLTVGPSSATAMMPSLTDWPAGRTDFTLNSTREELWPSTLAGISNSSETVTISDAAWQSLENNLFAYWGHKTLGSLLAGPETVSIPSPASVRTMNVRFRGPFSLYQPPFTTATVQSSTISDALNNLRLLWFQENAHQCSWARTSVTSALCTYKDIIWSVQAQQPVVSSGCQKVTMNYTVTFPTLTRDLSKPKYATQMIPFDLQDFATNSTSLQWLNLEGPEFTATSLGLLISTSLFSDSALPELYACSIDAQWGLGDAQTSFLGSPYVVDGMPSSFFAQNDTGSSYQGVRIKIEPEWASALSSHASLNASDGTTPIEKLLLSGQPSIYPESQSKIEAVLASIIAEGMANFRFHATLQINGSSDQASISSVLMQSAAAPHVNSSTLTMRTVVNGYAFGLRTADGISISAVLSVVVLSCYVLITVVFLTFDLFSKFHVNCWNNFTDMLTLALHSSRPSEMENTSAGVGRLSTLQVPVTFVGKDDSIEMVFGHEAMMRVVKLGYRPLQKEKAYA